MKTSCLLVAVLISAVDRSQSSLVSVIVLICEIHCKQIIAKFESALVAIFCTVVTFKYNTGDYNQAVVTLASGIGHVMRRRL